MYAFFHLYIPLYLGWHFDLRPTRKPGLRNCNYKKIYT
jgi:hypothetical protein